MSSSLPQASLALICLMIATSCENKSPAKKIWTEFSGEKALAHVQALVDLGPRPAGSDAIVRARAYLEEQLESSGWKVTEQSFTDQTPRGETKFRQSPQTELFALFALRHKNLRHLSIRWR
jgi:hypothetical protein